MSRALTAPGVNVMPFDQSDRRNELRSSAAAACLHPPTGVELGSDRQTGDRQAHQEVKNGAGFVQAWKKNGRNNQAATVFQKNNQAAACPPQ